MSICIIATSILIYVNHKIDGQASEYIVSSTGGLSITLPNDSLFLYCIEISLDKYNSLGEVINNKWEQELMVEWGGQSETFTLTNGEAILTGDSGEGYVAGSTIMIPDIPTSGSVHSSEFVRTEVVVKIIPNNLLYNVTINGQESITIRLEASTTATLDGVYAINDISADVVANGETSHTFLSLGGTYTYYYLINYFNVVAWERDIEGQHLVGSIITKERAYRTIGDSVDFSTTLLPDTREYNAGALEASDYSRGIYSYVGEFTQTSAGDPTFKLDYGFDTAIDSAFLPPDLYTLASWESGEKVYILDIGIHDIREYIKIGDGGDLPFLSPNNSGMSSTYKNNEFINFSYIQSALTSASNTLQTTGNIEGKTIDMIHIDASALTSVEVESGKSYHISNATGITDINIILPEGYDFFVNPYPEPTTINFIGEIKNISIAGIKHYEFPKVTINNEDVETKRGEDGEYSERGNKIIWNLPDLVTNSATGEGRLTLATNEIQNIPGHILAPSVEIWNYGEDGNEQIKWLGGNLNGSAMVKSYHSGTLETHMMPYNSWGEEGLIISVDKTLDGGIEGVEGFSFELAYKSGNQSNILNITDSDKVALPFNVYANEAGEIVFPALKFSSAGIYVFSLKENLGNDGDITYDQSEYEISVNVVQNTDNTMSISYTTTQIKSSTGEQIVATQIENNEVIFMNQTGISYTFYKENDLGERLKGAVFQLVEVKSATDLTIVEDKGTVTSNSAGQLIIPLEKGKTYKIEEIEAPEGYQITPGAYRIIIVDTSGNITLQQENGDVIIDQVIINEVKEFALPDTGGIGLITIYLMGGLCVIGGLILVNRGRIKE